MKRPSPNLEELTLRNFNSVLFNVRKLKRLWGTETVDENGTSVVCFNQRQYHEPTEKRAGWNPAVNDVHNPDKQEPEQFKKLYQFLGVYDDLIPERDWKGVEEAFLHFNREKADKYDPSTMPKFVADNLEEMWSPRSDNKSVAYKESLQLEVSIKIDSIPNNGVAHSPTKNHRNGGPLGISELDLNDSQDYIHFKVVPAIPLGDIEDQNWKTKLRTKLLSGVFNEVDSATGKIAKRMSFYEGLWKYNTITIHSDGVFYAEGYRKGGVQDSLTRQDPWLSIIARNALRPDYQNGVDITDIQLETQKKGTGLIVTLLINYDNFQAELGARWLKAIANDLVTEYDKVKSDDLINGRITKDAAADVSHYNTLGSNAFNSVEFEAARSDFTVSKDGTYRLRNYLRLEQETNVSKEKFKGIWVKKGSQWLVRADCVSNPRKYGLKWRELSVYLFNAIDHDYKKKKVSSAAKVVVVIIAAVITFMMFGNSDPKTVKALAGAFLSSALIVTVSTFVLSIAGADYAAEAVMEGLQEMDLLMKLAAIVIIVDMTSKVIQIIQSGGGEFIKDVARDMLLEDLDELGIESVSELAVSKLAESLTLTDAIIYKAKSALTDISFSIVEKLFQQYKANEIKDITSETKGAAEELYKLSRENLFMNNVPKDIAFLSLNPALHQDTQFNRIYEVPFEPTRGTYHSGNICRTSFAGLLPGNYTFEKQLGIV